MARLFPFALALLVLGTPAARAAGPNCQSTLDAMTRLLSSSVHIYSTETAANSKGKPRESEQIWVNHQIYILAAGRWRLSPASQDDLKKTMLDGMRESSVKGCRAVRDDAVNGEPAVLYVTHSDSDGITIDSQLWISKSRNLPLKQVIDMNTGGGDAGKSQKVSRYDYSNVQPPPGVH